MEKQHSPQSDSYSKFIADLPKDSQTLKALLSWYEGQCKRVLALLNSDAQIHCIKYDLEPLNDIPIAVLQSLTFQFPFHVSLIKSFIEIYSNKLCSEKMMLETYIDEIELLEKQRKYN